MIGHPQTIVNAAGLFVVSHMGVYDVRGANAASFLDMVCDNDCGDLRPGESLYTHFLTPDVDVIDDTLIYRHGWDNYLVVVILELQKADSVPTSNRTNRGSSDEQRFRMSYNSDLVDYTNGERIGFVTFCAIDGVRFIIGQAYLRNATLSKARPS